MEGTPRGGTHEVAFPQRRADWLAVRPLTISLNGSGFSEQQVRRAHKYVPRADLRDADLPEQAGAADGCAQAAAAVVTTVDFGLRSTVARLPPPSCQSWPVSSRDILQARGSAFKMTLVL